MSTAKENKYAINLPRQSPTAMTGKTKTVWDPLIRLFHWTLVISFFIAYLTQFDIFSLHNYAGYCISILLIIRILWGFYGSRYARFSDFVKPPTIVLGYLKDMIGGIAKRFVGHNPAGGAMVVALLVTLSATCLSGLMLYGLEGSAGPVFFVSGWFPNAVDDWFEEIHKFLSNLSFILIVFHVSGVLWSCLLHKENLVKSMITGKKRA